MVAPWPLTGRAAELDELGRQYRERVCGGVVLQAPAGVGKTRLADEAAKQLERAGQRVERAVGHWATQSIPLGALAHLLPSTLVADLGVGEDERTALFHGARAELRGLAGDDRLVLIVDDLDLLDDTSVAVIVPLIVSRTVFLIGTVRAGRIPSSSFTGLQRDGHLVRLDLEPLPPDELGALLHRVLDRPVGSRPFAELARLSGGNLQVLTELVRGARERGVLVEIDGVWQLTAPLPTTTALEELVAERLDGVDAAGLAVLELLAVCERFGLSDLELTYESATLEALEAGHLVTVVTSGRRTALRLAHPLYGEVLRERLPTLRLRRIHQQLADIVEAHGARRREDVVQVALWRVASGGRVPGDQLLRAARLALVGHDPALAVRLVSAAPADGTVTAGDRAEVLAEAHAMQGHDDEVERTVAAVWDEPLSDAQRAQLAHRLGTTRFYGQGDLEGALAAHETARERLTDPGAIGTNDARCATLLAGAGRPAEALRIADTVGADATPATRVELAAARSTSLVLLGRFDEAIALSRQRGRGARGAARLARSSRHRPPRRQRGPRAGVQRPLLRGAGPARARSRAGTRGERHGRLGVVRDGARRDRPRHRPGPGGDPTVRGRRRRRPVGGPRRRAGVGVRRCGARASPARCVRSSGVFPGAGRAVRRQPGGHVDRHPGASPCLARGLPR